MTCSRSLPLLLLLLLIGSPAARAAISEAHQKKLAEALALFQKGAYAQAVDKATSIRSSDKETTGAVSYFVATTYAKMQAYDKALPYYKEAIASGHKAAGLHYDYGQALYATQKLPEAQSEFMASVKESFKIGASAYYAGFIKQTLDDNAGALELYSRIQRIQSDPDKVKQPALVQIAEIRYDAAKETKDKGRRLQLLKEQALPAYEKARDFDSATPAGEQAKAKIAEIQAELDTNVPRFVNGVPYPRKPYSLSLSQSISYNSNVISQADDTLVSVSYKDSYVSKTGFTGKYQLNWRETFSFTPELASSLTYHSRRTFGKVFQNDNISIGPALRSKYEHMSGGKPATMLFDVEFNLMLRDYQQAHQFPFYSRYYGFTLGERVKWFATGTTTFKVGIKLNENYDPARNSYAPSVSVQQNVKIFGDYDLSNTLSADYLHARAETNDEKNYKISSSVTLPKLFWKTSMTPALAVAIKDTVKQRPTRGVEKNINPSLGLSRELTANLDGSLDYSFTRNISHARTTYQYSQHEIKLGVAYNL